MAMAQFRPAGLSDDDSESDDYGFYEKPARSHIPIPHPNMRKKIEVNLQDAILNGNLKEVEKIIICELNNNVNFKLDSGWTPLMHACFHAQDKIIQFMLEKGADPNLHADSVTPVMAVCSNSSAEDKVIYSIIKSLLEKQCILNTGDKYGQTPLMRAIGSGRAAVVRELLEHDVNIEMRDQQGWTAIFWAAHHNQPEIMEMLISHGARLTEVDKHGRTALEIAQSHEHQSIVDMLNKHLKIDETKDVDKFVFSSELRSWQDYYPGINKDKMDYSAEIPHLLYGMSCERLWPIIQDSGMDLRTFLLLEEDDMIKLGIDMPYERQRLKQGLRNFHLRGWKLNSVAGLYARRVDNYSVVDCLTTVGTHLQQVHFLEATVQYTLREYNKVQNQIKFEPMDSPLITKLTTAANNMLTNINSIRKEINIMKYALTKISRSNPQPADLIREKTVHQIALGYFSEAVVVCSLGLVIYYTKKLFTNFLNK